MRRLLHLIRTRSASKLVRAPWHVTNVHYVRMYFLIYITKPGLDRLVVSHWHVLTCELLRYLPHRTECMMKLFPTRVTLLGRSDALPLNPNDWVVGEDFDAIVTRVLDAYTPPRHATSAEVRDALPRLRVRPRPPSPHPTAASELSNTILDPTTAKIGEAGQLQQNLPSPQPGPSAALPVQTPTAVLVFLKPLEAADAESGCSTDSVKLRLQYGVGSTAPAAAGSGRQEVCTDSAEALTVQSPATTTSADVGFVPGPSPDNEGSSVSTSASAVLCGCEAVEIAAAATTAAAAASATDGYASCQPGELCTVCHDVFEPGTEVAELPCHHCFHEDCIMPWLQQVWMLVRGQAGLKLSRRTRLGPISHAFVVFIL